MQDINLRELDNIKADQKLIERTVNRVMSNTRNERSYNFKKAAVAASLIAVLGIGSFYSLNRKDIDKDSSNHTALKSSVNGGTAIADASTNSNTSATDSNIASMKAVIEIDKNTAPDKPIVANNVTPSNPEPVSNVKPNENTPSEPAALEVIVPNNEITPPVVAPNTEVSPSPIIENSNETPNNSVVNNPGITIPPINLTPTNGVQAKMLALVVYNGKIYTQSTTEFNQEHIKAFMGTRIGRTINSINEWNVKEKSTEELASNIGEQEMYTVKGYDSSFRIMSYIKVEDHEYAQFFDCLNGITIKTGKDIFGKLNLVNNIESAKFISFDDWNNGTANYINLKDVNILNEVIKELYTALPYEYQTIEDVIDNSRNNDEFREFTLKQKDGLEVKLTVYNNGYVSYGYSNIYFKVENSVINKLWQ